LLIRAGDLPSAKKAIDDALMEDPGFLPALEARIVITVKEGQKRLAEDYIQQLKQQFPNRAAGYRLAGTLFMEEGDFSGAAREFSQGMTVEPSSKLLIQHAQSEWMGGNKNKAASLLNDWLSAHNEDIGVRDTLARLYYRVGNLGGASKQYETLIGMDADNAGYYNNLANLYFTLNDSRALETARKAQQLAPESPATNDTLGWLLVQQKMPEEGLPFLRQAHARAFNQPEIRYHLATALSQLDRTSEARTELTAALATETPFNGRKDAQRLLSRLSSNP
jgi:predicted Zn-dependent protease